MQPYRPSWFKTHRKSTPIVVGHKLTGMSVLPEAAAIVWLRTERSKGPQMPRCLLLELTQEEGEKVLKKKRDCHTRRQCHASQLPPVSLCY